MKTIHLILTTSLLLPGCSDTFDSSYDTLSDAQRVGATWKGWIPRSLPPSSRNIKERHSIDSNLGWISFEFDSPDSLPFFRGLRAIPSDSVQYLPLVAPSVWWWDSSLSKEPIGTIAGRETFLFYATQLYSSSTSGRTLVTRWYFAARTTKRIVYGWTIALPN